MLNDIKETQSLQISLCCHKTVILCEVSDYVIDLLIVNMMQL